MGQTASLIQVLTPEWSAFPRVLSSKLSQVYAQVCSFFSSSQKLLKNSFFLFLHPRKRDFNRTNQHMTQLLLFLIKHFSNFFVRYIAQVRATGQRLLHIQVLLLFIMFYRYSVVFSRNMYLRKSILIVYKPATYKAVGTTYTK